MSRSLLAVPLLSLMLASVGYAGQLLQNGGFEGEFPVGLARGWSNNCWGKNKATFSPDTPHAGKTSQKVECQSYENGAIQFFAPCKLTAGKHYRISLWMRAQGGVGSVGVGLRQVQGPYTMHLSRQFEVGDEWESCCLDGTVSRSDDHAGLFIWFVPDGSATLWVDDVSVIEEDPIVERLPSPAGNVVPNGSFELALDRDWRSRTSQPSVDTDRPFHGGRSLRWEIGDKPEQLVSRMVRFGTDGRPFTLALAARAQGEATVVAELYPGVMIGVKGPLLRLECQPTSSWNEFRTTRPITSAPGGSYLMIRVRAKRPATVWLDAVRVEPGSDDSGFRSSRPLEATLHSKATAHIYHEGEPVELAMEAFSDNDQTQKRTLQCRVIDYWRQTAGEVAIPVDLKPRTACLAPVRLPIVKTGVYLAELRDGKDVLSELSFSVLPKPSPVPAERSAIGGHFRLDEFHMSVANRMGIKWTRIHDCETITHWNTVEPDKGHFVWADDKVRIAQRHGVQILGEFLSVPKWATSAGSDVPAYHSQHHPPRDLQEFGTYVLAAVSHYKDAIRDWEIWNEPYHTGFWRGTPEEYAELAKVAIQKTREADRDAVILTPSAHAGAGPWVERVLKAGGLRGADVFSYHGYDTFRPAAYRRFDDWAACGQKRPLSLWNTETGLSSQTFYRHVPDTFTDDYTNWLRALPYEVAAEQSTQLAVLALAGGAERYFQYWSVYEEALLPRLSAMSIFEYDGSLRPMAVAYAVAASLLDGTHGRGWIELPDRALANILTDDHRLIAVLWRTGGRRTKMLLVPLDPARVEIRNLMGNRLQPTPRDSGFELTLTGEPLYLVASALHGESLCDALHKAKRPQ